MKTTSIGNDYIATIGIECHVQLKTATKLFSGAGNDAREAPPNTLINHIDFGLPGALPVLNAEAVHLAMRAAFALESQPQPFSKFDRKHYFYPDLPMGYQITQYDQPIIVGGTVNIEVDGEKKEIGITRAHLEADAGKSTHPAGTNYSLVDLNRAGTPLLEIVSEPDMHTPAEAKAYVRELWLRMKYAGVSDADLYYGNMRFDVNVSVSKEAGRLGTRSETKNLNSFRSVEKTVEYEIERQIQLLEAGETIVQETRGWDDTRQRTFSQRSKENADDYRYMPDPDLPPVVLSNGYIEQVKAEMPVLPQEWRIRLEGLGLDVSQRETLLEAEIESDTGYLALLERHTQAKEFVKALANWFVNLEIPLRRAGEVLSELDDSGRELLYQETFSLLSANKLSSTGAKGLLTTILKQGAKPGNLEQYAEEQGYLQVSDKGAIAKIVTQVLSENAQAAEDVKKGEMKAIGFLTGQVMKASLGKADPKLAQDLIRKQLGV